MAVKLINKTTSILKQFNSLYRSRIRLGISGYSQLFLYSFLFCYPSFSYATPDLRGVVGGNAAATVHTHGLTTEVHQFQSSVIIDWNSLNLAADEPPHQRCRATVRRDQAQRHGRLVVLVELRPI